MLQTSMITGLSYEADSAVFFYNVVQARKYMENGAVPIDVFASQNKLIFVFKREDHARLKTQWMNGEL